MRPLLLLARLFPLLLSACSTASSSEWNSCGWTEGFPRLIEVYAMEEGIAAEIVNQCEFKHKDILYTLQILMLIPERDGADVGKFFLFEGEPVRENLFRPGDCIYDIVMFDEASARCSSLCGQALVVLEGSQQLEILQLGNIGNVDSGCSFLVRQGVGKPYTINLPFQLGDSVVMVTMETLPRYDMEVMSDLPGVF